MQANDVALDMQAVERQAARELACFIKAATTVLGQSDLRAGDIWLSCLEAMDEPLPAEGDVFRRVTLLALRRLHGFGHDDGRSPALARAPIARAVANSHFIPIHSR